MNKEQYKKYFEELRSIYFQTEDISILTEKSKKMHIYDEMYARAKNEKLKRGIYQRLSETDLENAITIETISKNIMTEVFREVKIDKPMGECWKKTS